MYEFNFRIKQSTVKRGVVYEIHSSKAKFISLNNWSCNRQISYKNTLATDTTSTPIDYVKENSSPYEEP